MFVSGFDVEAKPLVATPNVFEERPIPIIPPNWFRRRGKERPFKFVITPNCRFDVARRGPVEDVKKNQGGLKPSRRNCRGDGGGEGATHVDAAKHKFRGLERKGISLFAIVSTTSNHAVPGHRNGELPMESTPAQLHACWIGGVLWINLRELATRNRRRRQKGLKSAPASG